MVLKQEKRLGKMEIIFPYRQIQVRHNTTVIDDVTGEVIASNKHKSLFLPDHDISSIKDPEIVEIASAIWTDEVKQAWAKFQSE